MRFCTIHSAISTGAIFLVASGTLAAEGAKSAEKVADWPVKTAASFHAEYRALTQSLSPLPLDEMGTRLGQYAWAEQRLRLGTNIVVAAPKLRFELEADVLTGPFAGDTTTIGAGRLLLPREANDGPRRFLPRKASMALRTSFGEFRLGHTTSRWGLGLLANDGAQDSDFDVARLGDVVERVAFATRPFAKRAGSLARNIYIAVAGDFVYRDTNASVVDGDLAGNGVVSLFYKDADSFLGLYSAYRRQKDRDDDDTRAAAVDIAGDFRRTIAGGDFELGIGFEAFALLGSTNRLRPDASPNGVTIQAGAAVLRATLEGHATPEKPAWWGASIEGGFVSGDNDRTDGTMRAASLHPDYRVGMVLFPEVMAAMTARASDRLADPSLTATPPKGYEHLPSQGSVQNAYYLWPRVTIRPLPRLTLRAGVLFARAVADVIDPFLTNRAGGTNRNFFDRASEGSHDLGIEVNASVRYTQPLAKGLAVHVGVDWGHLFPGNAFLDATGKRLPDIDRVQANLLVDWRFE
ncbi:MAG: hypothetical protein HYY84_10750 [Deltaproteobacteria bacterium]|nr:hypothetical protein [Deltaproteobacteria bacterium]